MAKYLLTGIDDEKWRRFKGFCDLQGITMKQSFLHHINYIIVQGISQIMKSDANNHKPKKGEKKK